MSKLYGYFVNVILLDGPKFLPESLITNDGKTIVGFNKFEDTNPEILINYNWYEVLDPEISYDSKYQNVVYSAWYLTENNILTRDYIIQYISFENALTIAFNILDKNRASYEVGGFVYNYYGTDVRILTDKESSQGKLTASQICANNGTRSDLDVWKFIKESDKSTIVVQLSNKD